MKIDVKDNKKAGIDDIQVSLTGVEFSCDTIMKPSLLFWLSPSDADKLCFQLNAVLKDRSFKEKT
jgi:hypothetical protein